MELQIIDKFLQIIDKFIEQTVENKIKTLGLVPREQLKGRTIGIDEFRKNYCGGKSKLWVRTFIFDEFPETNFNEGGWCLAPHKEEGIRKTIIFEYEASKWMEAHRQEINWKGKLA